jgi:hypothetical protein
MQQQGGGLGEEGNGVGEKEDTLSLMCVFTRQETSSVLLAGPRSYTCVCGCVCVCV